MTKAIVLGGSRGIGKSISDSLKSIQIDVFAASKKDIDTSDLNSVKKFLEKTFKRRLLFNCPPNSIKYQTNRFNKRLIILHIIVDKTVQVKLFW